eukprot:1158893-Pelagomonas_calceolata.AAC.12
MPRKLRTVARLIWRKRSACCRMWHAKGSVSAGERTSFPESKCEHARALKKDPVNQALSGQSHPTTFQAFGAGQGRLRYKKNTHTHIHTCTGGCTAALASAMHVSRGVRKELPGLKVRMRRSPYSGLSLTQWKFQGCPADSDQGGRQTWCYRSCAKWEARPGVRI